MLATAAIAAPPGRPNAPAGPNGTHATASSTNSTNMARRPVSDPQMPATASPATPTSGKPVSSRMVVLPVRYRDEFRDSAEVDYRYDDDRIYRVDRSTNTILSLLDPLKLIRGTA